MMFTPLFWIILGGIFWGLHMKVVSWMCWIISVVLWIIAMCLINYKPEIKYTPFTMSKSTTMKPKVCTDYPLRAEEWQKSHDEATDAN